MLYKDMRIIWKINERVVDRWYGWGTVVKVLKTRIHIKLDLQDGVWVYDIPHLKQFVVKT
jgi:hypothetical protein